MGQSPHATARQAELAARAERVAIAVPVAQAALERLDRVAPVALVLRAPAALAASVAWVEPDGMRVVSPMAPLVVMRAPVALVAWAELRARRARTLQP
jgi:hypothetical protein